MEPAPARVAEQIFGHNKAPLEEVLAKDFAELAAEVDKAVDWIVKRPAKVKDETDFAATGEIAIRVRNLVKRIEETRKDETDPLYRAQKDIKAHFDLMAERLTKAVQPHQQAADDYTRAKAAEERRKREDEARKLREKEAAERAKAETGTGASAARAEGRAEQFAAQADAVEQRSAQSAAETVRTRVAGGGVATASQKWDFAIEDYDAIDLNKLRPFLNRDHVEQAIRSMVRVQKGNTNLPGVRAFQDTKAAFR